MELESLKTALERLEDPRRTKHTDFGRKVSMQKKCFAAALDPNRFLDILFAKL